ncbi:hypothetical protein C8Q79DRAFT_1000496 [Trametes meyenii]|nr:hypothetical protein C8Q79DRAFT_1000496 [Trametes meyenii]
MPNGVVFKGAIAPEVQQDTVAFSEFHIRDTRFAHSTGARLELREVELYTRPQDGKLQTRVLYEVTVSEDMLNRGNTLHGGCAAFMIDVCSSVALRVLGRVQGKPAEFVSQTIVSTFHAPAPLGATLNIVNTTTSFGARTVSARVEIWDATHRRLCVSGVHNKMAPSEPTRAAAKL